MNHLEATLVFGGIPLAVVVIIFAAVFATTPRPRTDDPKYLKGTDAAKH